MRFYCDRCGTAIDQPFGSLRGIADADADGDGDITDPYRHICRMCYAAWVVFMRRPIAAALDDDDPGDGLGAAAIGGFMLLLLIVGVLGGVVYWFSPLI